MATKTAKPVAKPARTKPGTRVETLPPLKRGVKLPNGYTPAYFRKRKTLAVLRAVDSAHYLVFNTSTGEKMQVASTKEASRFMSNFVKELKSSEVSPDTYCYPCANIYAQIKRDMEALVKN
jgi:hypothetical protein